MPIRGRGSGQKRNAGDSSRRTNTLARGSEDQEEPTRKSRRIASKAGPAPLPAASLGTEADDAVPSQKPSNVIPAMNDEGHFANKEAIAEEDR